MREWSKRNPEKIKIYAKNNYDKHKERFKKCAVEWGRNNPQKRSRIMVFQNAKRRSRIKANGGRGFTLIHWKKLIDRVGGKCAYCRKKPVSSIDHFIPISLGGKDDYTNIIPVCRLCNGSKSSAEPEMWIIKHFGGRRLSYVRSIMLTD